MADVDTFVVKRPPISMILKLVATVVILALVFYSLDLDKLSGALSAIDWHWLVLGSAASALFVSLRIIKWRELTRTNGMNASGKEIARTALLGLAVGLITPVRLGELVGVAPSRGRIAAELSSPTAMTGSTSCLRCWCSAFRRRSCCLAGPGAWSASASSQPMGLASPWRSRPTGDRNSEASRCYAKCRSSTLCSAPSSRPRRSIGCCPSPTSLPATLLLMCFIVGIEPIHDWHAVFILPVVTLSNLISITIGGLGVREGLAAALSPSVGLAPEVAAAAFFLSFFSTRLIPGIIGLAWTAMSTKRHSPLPQSGAA